MIDTRLENIPKEKFTFVNENKNLTDKELVTKPVGYLRDAWNRFKKNKASIVAAIIIAILGLFTLIGPIVSEYKVSYRDQTFKGTLPRIQLFYDWNIDFWDGCQDKQTSSEDFLYYYSMGVETGHSSIRNQKYTTKEILNARKQWVTVYNFRLDDYQKKGMEFKNLTLEEYQNIQRYQDEYNVQVIYPITDPALRPGDSINAEPASNANYWYKTTTNSGKVTTTGATINDDGSVTFENIYKSYSGKDMYTSKMRIENSSENSTPLYDYAELTQSGNMYKVRVNYYEYYIYNHVYVLKDGITKPNFIFGTTAYGQDLFTCLSSGARFSFIFAISVALVNLIVGAIYGAIEGYYGGKTDLLMERFVDILSAVPTMIVITLLKYHMKNNSAILIIFIAFFLTGWIGVAGTTRMQFYRYKNQEYVLAARTLGAKDARIMFKHIFPNSLGTLITSSVLIIPGMIFSETSLSYLGIINLNSGNLTSVGSLLADGQASLMTWPHIVLFPAIFISLLMLSFNLFGNGLRDAFNPSLRGSEE